MNKNYLLPLFLLTATISYHCTPHSAKVACEIEAEADYGSACRDLVELKIVQQDFSVPNYPPDFADIDLQEILLAQCVQYYYQLNECRERKGLRVIH